MPAFIRLIKLNFASNLGDCFRLKASQHVFRLLEDYAGLIKVVAGAAIMRALGLRLRILLLAIQSQWELIFRISYVITKFVVFQQ
jgi:hypothetical protein